MAKTAKARKVEPRGASERNYFTPAILTLLGKRLRRGNWVEFGDAAKLKPGSRKKSRAAR